MVYNPNYIDFKSEFIPDLPADLAPDTLESLFGDGKTYSDGLYFQSPEGNFLGQTKVIRNYIIPVLWMGDSYLRMKVKGYVLSVSDLPDTGFTAFDIFGIYKDAPSKEEILQTDIIDYYYYDTDTETWKIIEWLWTVKKGSHVPYPGVKIGGAHMVELGMATVIWNGFNWALFPSHSTLNNDEPNIHLDPTFLASVTDLQGGYNNLLASYLGNTTTGDEDLDGTAIANAAMQSTVNSLADPLTLMLFEAASLSSSWDIITGKYNSLTSLCSTLNIDATAFIAAYDNLHTELDTIWINQAVYPKVLASGDRANLASLLVTYNEEEILIVNAINSEQIVSFDDGFDTSQFKLVYDGFTRGFTPELELVYVSENELSLKPNYSDYEYLTINEQNIQASKRTSVFTQTPVLAWDENTTTLSQSVLAVETEYYVYLANRSLGFKIDSGTTPYDYRGKLFCSGTEPSNNYLGESGLGLNAILVGRAETSATGKFIHELDVSLISRLADTKETFREFSNFDLVFVDSDTLRLQKTYGTYGQMYIPESLYYLGDDREVYTSSLRIELDSQLNIVFDDSVIAADTTYYVYVAGDVDIYNNNAVNGATNRPWHPEDVGNPSLYDADLDLRLFMFLSTRVPDNGRLDESYKGFWTRFIGTIQTDANGKFKYANNISAIRQPTLNPTDLDGTANISLVPVSSSSFKIVKKQGTNGAVYVGGIPIYAMDVDDINVHTLGITSETKTYTEANLSSPLADSGVVVNTLVDDNIYVYLANDRDFWGEDASKLFFSTLAPTSGYLSANWPGSNARWICTIKLSPATYGSELVTNPTFSTNGTWTWGTGWTFDSNDLKAAHTTHYATGTLSQNITVVAGGYYELNASVRDRSVGDVSVSLGGTAGQLLWSNTSVRQYITATNTNGLIFTPNGGFDGSLDSIYCKKVTVGQLTGSYVTDSVGFGGATINDAVVSYNDGWSSAKIMEELNKLATQFGLSADGSEQSQTGLPLKLEYYSSTQVKLSCVNAIPVVVVFPDLTTIEITSSGILGTVTGAVDTLYYIYLDKDGLCTASTTAPDVTYPGKKTLGDTKILVGYLGFSATNTIAGDWNVYSYWNQAAQQWEQSVTNITSTCTFARAGFVRPTGVTPTMEKTGTFPVTFTVTGNVPYAPYPYASVAVSGSYSGESGTSSSYDQWGYSYQRFYISPGTFCGVTGNVSWSFSAVTASVINSFILSPIATITTAPTGYTDGYDPYSASCSSSWGTPTGVIRVTRPGNV